MAFTRQQGLVAKAGGLTLASTFVQPIGQPLVIECENASDIDLRGGETALPADDAGGGLCLRHVDDFTLNVRIVDPGDYRFWVRVSSKFNVLQGPAELIVDGVSLGHIYQDVPEARSHHWGWVVSNPFKLSAGQHTIKLDGYTIYYGARVDRIVLTTADAPAISGLGPAATPCALNKGVAESAWIAADGVTRWGELRATTVANGSNIRWFVRQHRFGRWRPLVTTNLAALDPAKPLQFRLEVSPNDRGATPWISDASITFDGSARTLTFQPFDKQFVGTQAGGDYLPVKGGQRQAPPLQYTALPDGGWDIQTENYTVTFLADGNISRLLVGKHDAIVPRLDGTGGTQFNLGRPQLQADGCIVSRGDENSVTWRFTNEAILFDGVRNTDFSAELLFTVPDDVVRVIDARTGRDGSQGNLWEKASPQYFFADGASLKADDEMQYGGGYGARLMKLNPATSTLSLGFYMNCANSWHRRITLHAHPSISDAAHIQVESSPPGFNFLDGTPMQLDFSTSLMYNAQFSGRAELTCTQWYADPPAGNVALKQSVTLDSQARPIRWTFTPPKPGLYLATMRLGDRGGNAAETRAFFTYGMDAVPPPKKPADFEGFWDTTFAKIQELPRTYQVLHSQEYANTILYIIQFSTIDNKPAWAALRVPKKPGKYPAVLMLPPVGNGAPMYGDFPDRVQMGVEVRGLNPTLPDAEAARTAPVKYVTPGTMDAGETRESMWLYYAYCTIARAYDILESLSQVDPQRIYITGASQGGGLTLAAASLRPQNAGAVAIIPGLCRLDWRNSNGGGWGPGVPDGPERERLLQAISYFDNCNLVPRIRSRVAIVVGLLDNHTPPHAAINAYYQLTSTVKEKRLVVNPWLGHSGKAEDNLILSTWMSADDPEHNTYAPLQ